MKGSSLSLLAALSLTSLLAAPAKAADDAGKKEFLAQKCNKCHAISSHQIEATVTSEKIKGPDLSDAGSKHDGAWMKQWVKKEVQLEGKSHSAKWEGSDKQLDTIVAWLAQLKK
jgi:hypothetical protein